MSVIKQNLISLMTSLFGCQGLIWVSFTVLQSSTTSSNRPCCHCLSWVDPKRPYLRVRVRPWHQESKDELPVNVKKLKYRESSRTKSSLVSDTVKQVLGLISLAKRERSSLPTTLNLGFNLLIQGFLHESALFFKVWVGRMTPDD